MMIPFLAQHFLQSNASKTPDRVFVIEQDGRHTYGEVEARANQLARLLARTGVRRGDRVGLLAHNSHLYVEAYYGILKAGGIAVPLNTAANPALLKHFMEDCGAQHLVVGPKMERLAVAAVNDIDGLRVAVAQRPDRFKHKAPGIEWVDWTACDGESPEVPRLVGVDTDVASIVFTSGSTGRPRGATLTHLNLVTNTRSIVEYLQLTADDRVLVVLPFYYVYGKSLLNTHTCVGGSVVLENRFVYPNVALDTLEKESCTGFSGVPSSFAILLNRSNLMSRELRCLRYVTQAGGAMSPALTSRLMEALPQKQIFVMYGATEAAARLSYLPPTDIKEGLGSIGRAIPNVELRVLRPDGTEAATDETGELVARGSNIMSGYWGAPEETAAVLDEQGYHTGDLARRDGRGLFFIVGRKKDMIKAGAHRVAAKEIEDAIAEHAAIHEVAVIGVPDEILGEKIRAFLVLRDGSACSADELKLFLKPRLPAYKIPAEIEFRTELPKNESGKIMKQALRVAHNAKPAQGD